MARLDRGRAGRRRTTWGAIPTARAAPGSWWRGADLPMGVRARTPEVKPVVYPDPVAHVLRWTGVPRATGVRIVDARGGTLMALPSASEVDVTALAPGVYILQLLDHDRVYRARFVKR